MNKITKLFFLLFVLTGVSCECPCQDEDDYVYYQRTKNDILYADRLLGIWQCYYPMVVGGMEYKQIHFMPGGKADITMARPHDTAWFTETYDYAYYGNTLRFSRNGSNISFHIEGFLSPELYLRDSFGHYTIAQRRVGGSN